MQGLTPERRMKNMIEKLVKSGVLAGEKVEAWQKKLEEQALHGYLR